jgi:hypothetical protein
VVYYSVNAGNRSSLCEGHGTGLRAATSGLNGGWVSGTCVFRGPAVVHKQAVVGGCNVSWIIVLPHSVLIGETNNERAISG